MYRVVIFAPDYIEHESFIANFPPSIPDEQIILSCYPDGCWLDVCRVPDDLMEDSISFRDEVDYELEPLIEDFSYD